MWLGCDVDITIDSLKTAIQVSNPVSQVKGLTSILKMKMTSVSITNFCHFVNGWRYIGHFSLKSVNKLLNENTKIEVSKTHLNYLVQKKGPGPGPKVIKSAEFKSVYDHCKSKNLSQGERLVQQTNILPYLVKSLLT